MDTSFSVQARELMYWLLVQSPLILVWLAGGVLALIFWKRNSRVSLLLLAGLIIALGAMLLDGYARVYLVHYLIRQDIGNPIIDGWRSAFTLTTWVRGVQFLIAAMYAVSWGFALGAVFGWRSAVRAPQPAALVPESPAAEKPVVQPAH